MRAFVCKPKTTGNAGGSKKALALRSPAAAEGSLVQRELSPKVTEGLYSLKKQQNNPSVTTSRATSLYTREAKDSCHICGSRATTASGG